METLDERPALRLLEGGAADGKYATLCGALFHKEPNPKRCEHCPIIQLTPEFATVSQRFTAYCVHCKQELGATWHIKER